MSIWCLVLIIHTGIWAITAVIANLFSPEVWSEATTGDKLISYLTAEIQLLKFISITIKIRKRIFKLCVRKWRERND